MHDISENRRKINEFCQQSGKYSADAYEFITSCVIEQVNNLDRMRHLSAREVVLGLKQQLVNHFGFLAGDVLKAWNIRQPSDIGVIIFDLISLNILCAADDDKQSDFDIDDIVLAEPAKLRKLNSQMEIPQID